LGKGYFLMYIVYVFVCSGRTVYVSESSKRILFPPGFDAVSSFLWLLERLKAHSFWLVVNFVSLPERMLVCIVSNFSWPGSCVCRELGDGGRWKSVCRIQVSVFNRERYVACINIHHISMSMPSPTAHSPSSIAKSRSSADSSPSGHISSGTTFR
jgi:hypothetical protein